jgi:hypothetical protein
MSDNPFVNPSEETVRAINEHHSKAEGLNLQYGTGETPLQVTEESPYPMIARALVYDYVRAHLDPTDDKHKTFGFDEVYVVSFSYVLGCWKAMLSTTLPDGMYYEVTFDVSKGLAYLDAYKRFDHKEIAIPSRRR